MPNIIFDGDAEMGEDGVLQGWCWNARSPAERPVVEISIGERVVSTNVASRFREDLRTRKIGDGYYGFMATLSKSVADAGERFVISARERTSGHCFWRHIRGRQALPETFAGRVDDLRHRLSRIGGSNRFTELGKPALAAKLAAGFGAMNAWHPMPVARARTRVLGRTSPVLIESAPNPKVALVIVARSATGEALSAVSALAPSLATLGMSLLLVDRGSSPEVALAPSLFGNLRYLFDPHRSLTSLLAGALRSTAGDDLIFLSDPPHASLAQGIAEILPQIRGSDCVHLKSRSAADACRFLGRAPPAFRKHTASIPIGLQFAASRRILERSTGLSGPEEWFTGLEEIDLAINALRNQVELCTWDEPAA
jgi:hypothetical protein